MGFAAEYLARRSTPNFGTMVKVKYVKPDETQRAKSTDQELRKVAKSNADLADQLRPVFHKAADKVLPSSVQTCICKIVFPQCREFKKWIGRTTLEGGRGQAFDQ